MGSRDDLANDVALMSAGYLWNLLKPIAELPPEEGYIRLAAHFRAALAAYRREAEDDEQAERLIPWPSKN